MRAKLVFANRKEEKTFVPHLRNTYSFLYRAAKVTLHFALFLNTFILESSKQGLILLIYNRLLEINYYPTAI